MKYRMGRPTVFLGVWDSPAAEARSAAKTRKTTLQAQISDRILKIVDETVTRPISDRSVPQRKR
jgi:hypothetical protein